MATTPDPTKDPLYTVKEAAALLRMYFKSVYRLIARGELRSVRIGRKVLIPASAIAEHIERS